MKTVTKLLDKAGKDPRLTPRILREKAEQRLSLSKGDLKPQREKIKDIIWDWWEKQKTAQLDREAAILKSVSKNEVSLAFHALQRANVRTCDILAVG